MTLADLLGAAMLFSLVLYALLGGADLGGGIWDLLALGPRKREQRMLVEQALGPIWEANHVWLVLLVVLLFTGFPGAFAALSISLFVPLSLLLVGMVLRGASFTFRAYDRPEERVKVRWGLAFSISSAAVPLVMGAVVGALASGKVVPGGPVSLMAWLSPFTVVVGLFTAALFAFLAAAYLSVEATGALREDYCKRAFLSGLLVFVSAALAGILSRQEAPEVFLGLTRRAYTLPLHLATGVAALCALLAFRRGAVRLGRFAAAAQVGLIVLGFGVSLHPYLLAPALTLEAAAAPRATLLALLLALSAGAVVLFPSLYLLFRVFKGERPFAVLEKGRGDGGARREPPTERRRPTPP